MKVFLIGVITLIWACMPVQSVVSGTVPPAPDRLLVIGDSLTSGLYASSENNTFASLVAAETGMQLARRHAATLANAETVWAEVKIWRPALVILEVGLNDVSRNAYSPVWSDAYQRLVTDMQASGATVLVCTTFWAGLNESHRNYSLYLALNEDIRQVASESGALLADVWNNTRECEECVSQAGDISYFPPQYSGDNFHPNDQGHTRIAQTILAALPRHRWYLPAMYN